jgi:hypothetical protein
MDQESFRSEYDEDEEHLDHEEIEHAKTTNGEARGREHERNHVVAETA